MSNRLKDLRRIDEAGSALCVSSLNVYFYDFFFCCVLPLSLTPNLRQFLDNIPGLTFTTRIVRVE